MSVYDIKPDVFNDELAKALKNMPEFKMPDWAAFVKTSVSKERPPVEKDFWYKRAASILRQIYIKGIVGVGRLRTRYGSKKNRGVKPERFKKGSGKIIRVILQQAETAGLLEKYKGKKSGRQLTEKGREFLDSIEISSIKSDEIKPDEIKSDEIKPEEEIVEKENKVEEIKSEEGEE